MKQLTLKLVLPLTILSFAFFTKWWYALPVDAPDTLYSGFPLPYVGDGWHTSTSFQFFILEFLFDFALYFAAWFLIVLLLNRFLRKLTVHWTVTTVLWIAAGIVLCFSILILSFTDHAYHITRPYNMEILDSGYKFFWEHITRPQ